MNYGTLSYLLEDRTMYERGYAIKKAFDRRDIKAVGKELYDNTGDAIEFGGASIGHIFNAPHMVLGALSNVPLVGRALIGFKNSVNQNFDYGRSPIEKQTGKTLYKHIDEFRKKKKW